MSTADKKPIGTWVEKASGPTTVRCIGPEDLIVRPIGPEDLIVHQARKAIVKPAKRAWVKKPGSKTWVTRGCR